MMKLLNKLHINIKRLYIFYQIIGIFIYDFKL